MLSNLEWREPMKKSLRALAATLAVTALPGVAQAADEHTFAFNAGAVSDYRYRGISQTRLKPAVQGGIDYSHSSGFYVGTWASTIKWIQDFGGDSDVEIDLYGGYKGSITEGLSFDVGALQYWYPDNNLNPDADTTEIYGALTFGPATLKYSHSLTDTFGNRDSKNSYYLDASATFELPYGLMFTPHLGYQKIKGPFEGPASYTDYSVTVAKEVVKGLVVSLAAVGTDADKNFYVPGPRANSTKFLGKTGVVVGVKYNF
jgi:uncharacterized protein (TIGR02001 family)